MKNLAAFALAFICGTASAQDGWSPNTIPIRNPWDYGATHLCAAGFDDSAPISAAVADLPVTGGIVFFGATCTRKEQSITITKSHVLLWSENRYATIYQRTAGVANRQAIVFSGVSGGGVYGLRFTTDAAARFAGINENAVSYDTSQNVEAVGNEVFGARAVGLCFVGTTNSFIEGNYVHDTYADHIYHSNSGSTPATQIAVWNNRVSGTGDDGISAVTYGVSTARVDSMEVWSNTIVRGDARGVSCVGCSNWNVHDNLIFGTAGAGILTDSEPAYSSPSSFNLTIANNRVHGAAHTIGHPCILVGANNYVAAGQSHDIALTGNFAYGCPNGSYGSGPAPGLASLTNTGLVTSEATAPPQPAPVIQLRDTSILRTRDTSFVASGNRPGLYRIHVRRVNASFQMRFEYLVKGPPGRVSAWAATEAAKGGRVSEVRVVAGVEYALVLTPLPTVFAPFAGLSGVTWAELRSSALSWMWIRTETDSY